MGLPCVICSPSSDPCHAAAAATNGAHLIHPSPVPLGYAHLPPRRVLHNPADPVWQGVLSTLQTVKCGD